MNLDVVKPYGAYFIHSASNQYFKCNIGASFLECGKAGSTVHHREIWLVAEMR